MSHLSDLPLLTQEEETRAQRGVSPKVTYQEPATELALGYCIWEKSWAELARFIDERPGEESHSACPCCLYLEQQQTGS